MMAYLIGTAKTIARIERGETEAPHGRTLRAIAARLQVEPKEITSY
jgi:transcriptional regulator with XRE-family HTH domain